MVEGGAASPEPSRISHFLQGNEDRDSELRVKQSALHTPLTRPILLRGVTLGL